MSLKFSLLILWPLVSMFSAHQMRLTPSTVNDCTTSEANLYRQYCIYHEWFMRYVGCHSASAKSGGFDLSNYNTTKSAATNSKFLKSIKHESGVSKMPQGEANYLIHLSN